MTNSLFSIDQMVGELMKLAVSKVVEELRATLREPSPGLIELLNWLDSMQTEYAVATEHDVGAPPVGYHGRTAILLRFFQSEWARRGVECERLLSEISDLRQKLVLQGECHHRQLLAIGDGARREAERAMDYLARAEKAEAELSKANLSWDPRGSL